MRFRPALTLAATTAIVVVGVPTSEAAPSPHPVESRVRTLDLDTAQARRNAAVENVKAPTQRSVPESVLAEGSSTPRPPRDASPGAAEVALLTAGVRTETFSVMGVTWDRAGPQPVGVYARVLEDGAWSDWSSLGTADDGPDPGSAEAQREVRTAASSPLAAPGARGIQIRVDTADGSRPTSVRAVLVNPGNSEADQEAASAASSAALAPGQPAIVTRAQWGADEGLRLSVCPSGPDYSATTKAAVVHHTVSTNTYSPAEVPGILRGIYAFHVQGRGWCDVGYQFLVDRFGTLYEGRYGGIARPLVGAHAGGFNTDTFGVSLIGEYTSTTPSGWAMERASQVIGWKLGLYRRDPLGRVALMSAGSDKYPLGTTVQLPAVMGHRDTRYTDCPGEQVYPSLGNVRGRAAQVASQTGAGSPDLWGALVQGTPQGTEVHSVTGSSGFTQEQLALITPLPRLDPAQWSVFFGSLQGDGRPDLIAVRTRGSASGNVEVHALSWASDYKTWMVHASTAMPSLATGSDVQVAVGPSAPGSGPDLFFFHLNGTGSRRTEVHVLSASSGYREWVVHAATPLQEVDGAKVRFLVDPQGSGDVWFVPHAAPTGSGRTELHAITRASGYQLFSVHAAMPFGYTSDAVTRFALGDIDTDGVADLVSLDVTSSGSGRVDIHGLGSRQGYGAFVLHAVTPFKLGQWNASFM